MTTLPHSASSSPMRSEPCVTGSAAVVMAIKGSPERFEFVAEHELRPVLSRGRCRGIDAIDRGVVTRDDGRHFAFECSAHGRIAALSGAQQRIPLVAPGAGFLVRLDPGWRNAGVLEQVVGKRHLAGIGIGAAGEWFALMGQVL